MSSVEDTATPTAGLAIPPEWQVVDLGRLEDRVRTRAQIERGLDDVPGEDLLASRLSELVAGAADQGVIFAASCRPGDGESIDLSTVTLALRRRPDLERDEAEDRDRPAGEGIDLADGAGTEPEGAGDDIGLVSLPAGEAARAESFDLVELDRPFGPIPVLCVEYVLALPADPRVAVLTFTTVAPSDIDALRVQFAEMASTLSFA
jgi:hypothetical protein